MKSLAAGIAKAGSTDTEKLIAAFRGLKVEAPVRHVRSTAPATIRRRSAPLSARSRVKNGKGTMSDFKYVDGATVLPSDDEVKKLRPAAP